MNQFYVLHDSDLEKKKQGALILNDHKKAVGLNKAGYGIFWAINTFKDGKRKEENITRINAWFVDMDEGTKKEQLARIKDVLTPSFIVETKNGFHAYWLCEEELLEREDKESVVKEYKTFLKECLCPALNGDTKACDAARILRVPNFFHMKNPKEPFLVTSPPASNRLYKKIEMIRCFPFALKKKVSMTKHLDGDSFWIKAGNINCREALERLSGSEHVSGEIFTFHYSKGDKANILVDGKSTSCWLDRNGMIGSSDKGGPSIGAWLNWYHNDWKKVRKILLEIYPELK